MGFTRVWPISMQEPLFFLVFQDIIKILIKILLKILINYPWGPLTKGPRDPRGNSERGPRGPREILKGAPGAINQYFQ